jgi:hypothetical protein
MHADFLPGESYRRGARVTRARALLLSPFRARIGQANEGGPPNPSTRSVNVLSGQKYRGNPAFEIAHSIIEPFSQSQRPPHKLSVTVDRRILIVQFSHRTCPIVSISVHADPPNVHRSSLPRDSRRRLRRAR